MEINPAWSTATHGIIMQGEEKPLPKMCGRKIIYDKKGIASFMNAFQKHRGRNGRADKLRSYHCEECNGWHLTKGELYERHS